MTLDDLCSVHPNKHFCKLLRELNRICEMRERLLLWRPYPRVKNMPPEEFKLGRGFNCTVEDLGLTMQTPDYSIELVPNGANVPVTLDNLRLYVDGICKFFLVDGIALQ